MFQFCKLMAFFKKIFAPPFFQLEHPKSSLGFKYPTNRDHPLHTADLWLQGKRQDDGAEDLWRINDQLYDLTDFLDNHPGGKDWLILTKGTDITEAFECHHISDNARILSGKYFVRKASTPRNSPFTFEETGFYRSLRKKIREALKDVPEDAAHRSKIFTDVLFVAFFSTALLSTYFRSFTLGVISGVSLALLANAAHNFFHQKDNFRMYYFDFTLMSSRGWRISHALSHHLYTNTVYDYEISSLEPFLQYLPQSKPVIFRYPSWFYSPVFYMFMFTGYFIRGHIQNIIDRRKIRPENLLPGFVLFSMFAVNWWEPFWYPLVMFLFIHTIGGVWFGFVGVNAAHHHPKIFHDGDSPREENMDWGIYQLDAVMDRTDITGSHFLVLTNYGDHGLHHLFPTIDHGKLQYLYPVFQEVCREFGVELKMTTQFKLILGQYRQLVKIEPNKNPPGVEKICNT